MKKKTPTRKTAAKKTTARKAPAKKTAAKKTATRKTAAKKTAANKTDNTLELLKSVLKRMIEIRDNMEDLNAEMRDLYTSATQLVSGIEDLTGDNISSGNPIYQSKLWKFLTKEKPVIFIPPKLAKERKWTNQDGKTIIASLVRLTEDEAVLKTKGGVEYRYPVEALSAKNQEEIAALTP